MAYLSEDTTRGFDAALLLTAAGLGLVEGATEFIPVSSTGHLILVQDWLGFTGRKENAFAIFIQLGAILAVVWLYRKKFLHIAASLHRDPKARRLVINLIVGMIPAVVVGLPTDEWIEAHFFKPFPVGLALVLGGVAILVIEHSPRQTVVENVDDLPVGKAFWIGVVQVFAILFPGVSRSGATIMGGLLMGLSRTAAAEFSFFLAIPARCGASLVALLRVRDEIGVSDAPVFATGFFVSFVAALVVIKALLAFVSQHSFSPFAWYRIVLGTVILLIYSGAFSA
jgi:undecaprenyl-diphosphatase